MKNLFLSFSLVLLFAVFALMPYHAVFSEGTEQMTSIDATVKAFLKNHQGSWEGMNAPEADTKTLYDIILKNNYRKALEIGTFTGHSTVWIAWALSKTSGKLITIEINEESYKKALSNLKEAGLSEYVDARLADAHTLVKELKGPFDFVFCDADKDWYKNYFIDVFPKLEKGGCFAAHNVSDSRTGRVFRNRNTAEFFDYIKDMKELDTTVFTKGAGMSISYKK